MKKILLAIITMSMLQFVEAQNAIPNPGFETWNVNPNYDDPAGWGTINGLTYLIGVRTVTKATGVNSHSGTAAIRLESKNVPFQGNAPGIAATGTINTNGYVDGGVAYTRRPISMSGWYKYTPGTNDTGSIEATLSKWVSGSRVDVGHAQLKQNLTVGSYTQFTANFTYYSAAIPDTLVIILLTSTLNTGFPLGSILYVDDLSFDLCGTFSATTSSTNATCTANNGSATVNPSNGTNPYSFLWSNNGTTNQIFNITAGSYTVTVTDANECTVTANATVNANSNPITVTASSTQSSCASNTGSVTASGSNGAQPYSYTWSDNSTTSTVSNLGAGTYTVTITDSNGCSGTGTTSVTTPSGPSATGTVTPVLCNGGTTGSINISVTGGTGNISYLWSNTSTTEDQANIGAGPYCVTITDANNCSFSLCETVSEPTTVSAVVSTTDVTTNGGSNGTASVTVSGGTTPYQAAQWSNSVAGNAINGLVAGVYCVTVSDANNCSASACDTVFEPAPSAINDLSDVAIKLYPNPASSKITIEINSAGDKFTFSLFNLEGRLVEETKISNDKTVADIKHLSAGLYTYQLKNILSGAVSNGKLQIER